LARLSRNLAASTSRSPGTTCRTVENSPGARKGLLRTKSMYTQWLNPALLRAREVISHRSGLLSALNCPFGKAKELMGQSVWASRSMRFCRISRNAWPAVTSASLGCVCVCPPMEKPSCISFAQYSVPNVPLGSVPFR